MPEHDWLSTRPSGDHFDLAPNCPSSPSRPDQGRPAFRSRRYVAPGHAHTIVLSDEFSDMEVEGARLVDFLTTLVAGGVPADVRCTECR